MTDTTSKENDCMEKANSNNDSFLLPICDERQSISLNSPNHLNGSIITVQKSSTGLLVVTPFESSVSDNQHSPISSLNFSINSNKVALMPSTVSYDDSNKQDPLKFQSGLSKLRCITTFEPELRNENASKNSACESEAIVTVSRQHQSKTTLKLNPTVPSIHSSFLKNFKLCTQSNIENGMSSLFHVSDKSSIAFGTANQGSLIKLKKYVNTFPKSLNIANRKDSKSIDSTCEQILISTGLQSGAHVSMKPVSHPSEKPIYFSDCESFLTSFKEPIKIKEEPLDLSEGTDSQEPEKFDFKPIIVSVSSLREKEIKSLPNVEFQTIDSGTLEEKTSTNARNSVSRKSKNVIEDDDYSFVMTLLPKLRQLPNDLKKKLKCDVQKLVSSTVARANRRKRKASEIG